MALTVRREADVESEQIRTLKAGTMVRVLERRELPSGILGASIAEHSRDRPNSPRLIGWVNLRDKDGQENLTFVNVI